MRRIIRLWTLGFTLAAGCLGGVDGGGQQQTQASDPTQSSSNQQQPSNQNNGSQPANVTTGSSTPTTPMGSQPLPAATAELAKFAKCMQQADYTSSGMQGLADQLTDSGVCRSCHQSGAFAVFLSKDPVANFTHLQSAPFLYKFAQLQTDANGAFMAVVQANRFVQRGAEVTLMHPAYTLSSANSQAIQTFFDATMTHYKAGNCP
jgi:hypothetical protein